MLGQSSSLDHHGVLESLAVQSNPQARISRQTHLSHFQPGVAGNFPSPEHSPSPGQCIATLMQLPKSVVQLQTPKSGPPRLGTEGRIRAKGWILPPSPSPGRSTRSLLRSASALTPTPPTSFPLCSLTFLAQAVSGHREAGTRNLCQPRSPFRWCYQAPGSSETYETARSGS